MFPIRQVESYTTSITAQYALARLALPATGRTRSMPNKQNTYHEMLIAGSAEPKLHE